MLSLLFQFPHFLQRLINRDAVWCGPSHLSTFSTTSQPLTSQQPSTLNHQLSTLPPPLVYLTFDDGPIPEVTPAVLDILDRYGVKATFFWVGDNVRKYPEVAREVVRRGHHFGNHSFNHLNGWRTPHRIYIDNIVKADRVISDTIGQSTHLFRPPYGKAGMKSRHSLRRLGYQMVLWDIITHDYNTHDYTPECILRIVRRCVRPGSVILLHDSLKSQSNTLPLLPSLIEYLQSEGYAFGVL